MLSVDEAVIAVAQYRRVRGHSEATIRLDSWVLRAVGVPPERATLADLERVVMRSTKRSSRAMYVARIRSCFKALRELGLITNHADEQLPRLRGPATTPRPLTDEQVVRLVQRMEHPHVDVVRVALLAGARAMEVWAMTGADLTDGPHGPELLLHGKGDKHATVPAHPAVVEIVTGYGKLGRLWPEYTTAHRLSQVVGGEMRRVLGEGVEFHQCRHTFGTRVYRATGDIYLTSRLMRHASVQTTQIYASIADERPRAAIDLLAG